MDRKEKGFTLIEMLVVVVIVGILAGLLIPVFLVSIQKAKQKGTMQDMNGIAKSIVDYVTDVGYAPTQSGPIVPGSAFLRQITPFYVKAMPIMDQWGTAFSVYCGTAVDSAGIGGVTSSGPDDFVIVSYGRDRMPTSYTYDPLNPAGTYFDITALPSFDEDLVIWNGSWIHAPRSAQLHH